MSDELSGCISDGNLYCISVSFQYFGFVSVSLGTRGKQREIIITCIIDGENNLMGCF